MVWEDWNPRLNIIHLRVLAWIHCASSHTRRDITFHLNSWLSGCFWTSRDPTDAFSCPLTKRNWLPNGSNAKESACSARDSEDAASIPGSVRSPGGFWNSNPLQYFCLENPTDRGPGGLQSIGLQKVRHDWAHVYLTKLRVLLRLRALTRSSCHLPHLPQVSCSTSGENTLSLLSYEKYKYQKKKKSKMVIQNYHCILYYQNLVILQKKKKSNSGEFLPRQLPGTKIVKWEQMGVTQKERECMHLESSRTPEPVSWEAPPGDSRVPRLVSYITNRGNRALEMQCPQFQRGDQSCWHQTEPNCQYVAKPSQPLGQSCTQHWPLHIWVGAQSPKQLHIFKHDTWVQGSPVVMTLRFHCRGCRLDPWLGN